MKKLILILLFLPLLISAQVGRKNRPLLNPVPLWYLSSATTLSPMNSSWIINIRSSVFNVKDYGAKGDSITDDTAALQAALDAVGEGGTVFMPAGIYKITATIYLKNNTLLQGAGSGNVTMISGEWSGTTIDARTITAASAIRGRGAGNGNCANISMENFQLVGPAYTAVADADGLQTYDCVGIHSGNTGWHFSLSNIVVDGFAIGVELYQQVQATLYNVKAGNARTNALLIAGGSDITVLNGMFQNSGNAGSATLNANILVNSAAYGVLFLSPLIDEGGAISLWVKDATDVVVQGALIYSSPTTGVKIGNGTTTPTRVKIKDTYIAPFSEPQSSLSIIDIQTGSVNTVLENVTTHVHGANSDIINNGTGTQQINVNGAYVFRGDATLRAATGGRSLYIDHTATDGFSALYAQENGVTRGYFQLIGSTHAATARRNDFEFGTVDNSSAITFRPGETEAMRISNETGITVTAQTKFVNNLTTNDSLITRSEVSSLADSASITMATGVSGWGEVMIGDNQEWAHFRFTSAGVVTLIANSTNVATDGTTDNKLQIYDGGAGIIIKNLLGSRLKCAIKINYYTP